MKKYKFFYLKIALFDSSSLQYDALIRILYIAKLSVTGHSSYNIHHDAFMGWEIKHVFRPIKRFSYKYNGICK